MRPCIQLAVANPDTTMLIGNIPQTNENTSDGEQEDNGKVVFSIGRSPNSKLCLTHEDVSYHHAQIVYQSIFFENVYWLRDVGSKNGTFLNGKRLSAPRVASGKEEHRLKLGDKITIGSATNIEIQEAPWSVMKDLVQAEKKSKKEKKQVQPQPAQKGLGRISNAQLRAAFSSLDDDEREHRSHKLHTETELRYVEPVGVDPTPGQRQEGEGGAEPEIFPYIPVQGHVTDEGENVKEGKGAKLLRAMGWADGQRLGKNETGLAAPIEAGMSTGRAGLGFGDSDFPTTYIPNPSLSYAENGKRAIFARYEQTKPQ